MAIDSFAISNMLAANMAATGNMRMFSQSIGNPMAGGSYSAPPATPSPLTSAANIMGMAMQRPAMPGSPEAGLQGQQMGLGVMGAVMSPQTPIVGQVYQNMQQQSMFNQAINQQMTFARPGGFGFNFPQMQAMSGFVGGQAGRDPRYTQQQMFGLAGGGMQMGMFQGTRSVQQFQQQFKQLLNSVEQVTKIMGGTLEEGLQHINRMRGMGVFQRGDQLRMTQNVMGLAAGGGVPVNQLMQFGGQMAQALRPMGVQGPAGVQLGAQVLANVGAAQRGGAFSEQQLWQATGLQGVAGQQAFAGRLVQMGAKSLSRGNQRLMAAAFVDPTSGKFDEEAWQQYRSGGMGLGEVQRQAHQNIQQMGGAIAWKANESQIRGEYLKGTQGMGWVHTLRQQLGQHMHDPNKAKILLQRYTGATREEAGMLHSYMQKLPMIEQEQKEAAEIQEAFQKQQARWEAMDPALAATRMKNRLAQKIKGPFENIAKALERGFTEGAERMAASMGGQMSAAVSAETRQEYSRLASTTGGMEELKRRGAVQDILYAEGGGGATRASTTPSGRWERMKESVQGLGFLERFGGLIMGGKAEWSRTVAQGTWGMKGAGTAASAGTLAQTGTRGWGIGKSTGDVYQLRERAVAMAQTRKDGMVVQGLTGQFMVVGSQDMKQRQRMDQISGGNVNFDSGVWEIDDGRYQKIIGSASLKQSVMEALGAKGEGRNKAAEIVMEATGLQGHTARAIVEKWGKDLNMLKVPGLDIVWQSGASGSLGFLNEARASASAIEGNTKYDIDTGTVDALLSDSKSAQLVEDMLAGGNRGERAKEKLTKGASGSLLALLAAVEKDPGIKRELKKATGAYGKAGRGLEEEKGAERSAKAVMKLNAEDFSGKAAGLIKRLQASVVESVGEERAAGDIQGFTAKMTEEFRDFAAKNNPKVVGQMAAVLRAQGDERNAAILEQTGGRVYSAKHGKTRIQKAAWASLAAKAGLVGKDVTRVGAMIQKGGGARQKAIHTLIEQGVVAPDMAFDEEGEQIVATEAQKTAGVELGALTGGLGGRMEYEDEGRRKEREEEKEEKKKAEPQEMKFDPNTKKLFEDISKNNTQAASDLRSTSASVDALTQKLIDKGVL